MPFDHQTIDGMESLSESKLTVHLTKQLIDDNPKSQLQHISVPSTSDWISKYRNAKKKIDSYTDAGDRVMDAGHKDWCDIHISTEETNLFIEAKGTNDSTTYNIRASNGQFLLEAGESLNEGEVYSLAVPVIEAKECWNAWTNNSGNVSWSLQNDIDALQKTESEGIVMFCTPDNHISVPWSEFFHTDFSQSSSQEIIAYYMGQESNCYIS